MDSNPMITLVGRLTTEPELRFTPNGKPVASFTVVTNDRHKVGTGYEDKDATFHTCSIWAQAAENLAEAQLAKGQQVVVVGKLRQRSYETRDGDKRTVFEVLADTVGVSVQWNTVKVVKPDRTTKGTKPSEDPWATQDTGDSTEPPF